LLYWAPISSRINLTSFIGAAAFAGAIYAVLNKMEGYSKKGKL